MERGAYPCLMPDDAAHRREKVDQQRRELPDSPGVYVFRDGDGAALYVGKANSIRKRVASHFSGKGGGLGAGLGGTSGLLDRIGSIEILVNQTQAQEPLAGQS